MSNISQRTSRWTRYANLQIFLETANVGRIFCRVNRQVQNIVTPFITEVTFSIVTLVIMAGVDKLSICVILKMQLVSGW